MASHRRKVFIGVGDTGNGGGKLWRNSERALVALMLLRGKAHAGNA
jgi:hypothetical protein